MAKNDSRIDNFLYSKPTSLPPKAGGDGPTKIDHLGDISSSSTKKQTEFSRVPLKRRKLSSSSIPLNDLNQNKNETSHPEKSLPSHTIIDLAKEDDSINARKSTTTAMPPEPSPKKKARSPNPIQSFDITTPIKQPKTPSPPKITLTQKVLDTRSEFRKYITDYKAHPTNALKSNCSHSICKSYPACIENIPSDLLEGISICPTGQEFENATRLDVEQLIKRFCGKVTKEINSHTTLCVNGNSDASQKFQKCKEQHVDLCDITTFIYILQRFAAEKAPTTLKPAPPSISKITPRDIKFEMPAFPSLKNLFKEKEQENFLLVDKYKPKTLNEVVGNRAPIGRIKAWLENWQAMFLYPMMLSNDPKKRKSSAAKPPSDRSISVAGATSTKPMTHRATFITGPPGIGKTTSARLLAEACNYHAVEYNASDCRNKEALDNAISKIKTLNMGTIHDPTKKVCLIMDEVDGIAGNGDRGGLNYLIEIIKTSHIPIICIANDRTSDKSKRLISVCNEERFTAPNPEALARYLMETIVPKEQIQIDLAGLKRLVEYCRQDIRNIINQLSIFKLENKKIVFDSFSKEINKNAPIENKDVSTNLFDGVRQVFSYDTRKRMSLFDCTRIYFCDDMVPLLMQENYPNLHPQSLKTFEQKQNMDKIDQNAHLAELIMEVSESFSQYDLCDTVLRTRNDWILSNHSAVYSVLKPSYLMQGSWKTGWKTDFTQYLGSISRRGKCGRLLDELAMHMTLTTHKAMGASLNFGYLSLLHRKLIQALYDEDLNTAVALMHAYSLSRSDLDAIDELVTFKNESSSGPPNAAKKTARDVLTLKDIPAKTKASFTARLNADHMPVHYADPLASSRPTKRARSSASDVIKDTEEQQDDPDVQNSDLDEDEDEKTVVENSKLKKDPSIKEIKPTRKGKLSAKKVKVGRQ